jgi:hypothetical protein
MIKLLSFVITSLLLVHSTYQTDEFLQSGIVSEHAGPPSPSEKCPDNFATTCNLQCPDGKYLLDTKGCPTCTCASSKPVGCPLFKCRDNCGDAGYKLNEKGCQTCACKSTEKKDETPKTTVQCSRVMCRMYCINGFRRDANGCEICKCNDSPQPCPKLTCEKSCSSGYRKDYSGCQTCDCECPSITCSNTCPNGVENNENGCPTCTCKEDDKKVIIDDGCSPMVCNLDCKYGYERDPAGCQLCSCTRCPLHSCRMFCMYGFKKNSDGCDLCECDSTPISENIPCSERFPCSGNRVCNLNLNLCELVNPDKVNWFVYDFDIKTQLFEDAKFVTAFKSGLIHNIAEKYNLERTQIVVSSVERDGMTSFQVMPFNNENMDDFEKKMDLIDIDLNSHEFRKVLPAVVNVIGKGNQPPSKWARYIKNNPRFALYLTAVGIGLVAMIFAGVFVLVFRRRVKYPVRSESKSPIFDSMYQQAPTDDDHYHAVHAPDGTAYVVVESDDIQAAKDRRAIV